MSRIRVGLIGYGAWVKTAYIPALRHDGRAQIVAISAKRESTMACIQQDFGNDVETYQRFEELLQSPTIDAVMVAVPDALHATIITSALHSGKAVFYEPPLAHTRERIPEVINTLVAAPQITHADLELACVPAVAQAARFIKDRVIGSVQTARIRLHANWGPDPNQDTNNINRLSVWYTHVLNVLLNSTPTRVLLLDGYGTAGRRQSHSTGVFDYDGIWGELTVNTDSVDALAIDVDIIGSEGEIRINLLTGVLEFRTKTNPGWNREELSAIQPYAAWPGMHESITAFLDAVSSGTPSFANADIVANLHLIGMATEESKDTGTWAEVRAITIV